MTTYQIKLQSRGCGKLAIRAKLEELEHNLSLMLAMKYTIPAYKEKEGKKGRKKYDKKRKRSITKLHQTRKKKRSNTKL